MLNGKTSDKDKRGVTSGIELPLEMTLVLCGLFAMVGACLGQRHTNWRLDPRRKPLNDLLKPNNLGPAIDLALHRNARRHAAHAVLQGRIDQFADRRDGWCSDTQEQVREHIAAVMRVGLRRDDRVTMGAGQMHGDGFTILIPGANERAAVHVADRLRRKLGSLHLPQFGDGVRITASFGVAADRFGEDRAGLGLRARRALDVAMTRGMDHVVPASEIEEIMLLPAPTPSSSAGFAAA